MIGDHLKIAYGFRFRWNGLSVSDRLNVCDYMFYYINKIDIYIYNKYIYKERYIYLFVPVHGILNLFRLERERERERSSSNPLFHVLTWIPNSSKWLFPNTRIRET